MGIKRKKIIELTIEMKKEVLDLLDKGDSQRKIAEAFSVAKSTVGNIGKNRIEILKAWNENCCSERKRKLRKTENEELNNLVFEFFCKCRSIDIPVSGPMLQSKAKEIAEKLDIEKFQASNGWLESFQRRHNINFRILCGESAAADLEVAAEWKSKLPNLLKEYTPEDQFNADEFALLYRQMPRKSLVVKGEKCAGGKLAKERLTVLACCSSTGEKLKPLVIGNAERPRVFKANGVDPKNLPVTWRSNKKAWMTGNLFEEWLTDLNQQMEKSKRKILLLVDNATSHNCTKILSHVTVKFLPPNLTSEVQPLDQGIIRAVKARYRKKMLQHLITVAEDCDTRSQFLKSISVLHAVRWVNSAWQEISPESISKCFQRSGFKERIEGIIDEDEDVGLAEVINSFSPEIQNDVLSVDEIINADAELILHEEIPTAPDDILHSILQQKEHSDAECYDSDNDETVNDDSTPVPTHKEALQYLAQLLRYSSSHQPQLMDSLFKVQSDIEKHLFSATVTKQMKISDFFVNSKE